MHAQYDRSSGAAKALRKKGGTYLKQLREAAHLTQRELAMKVGLAYYTFISQIENGTGRPPPELYGAFADALGVDVRKFAVDMLKYYDPWTFKWLGGSPIDINVTPKDSRSLKSELH